MKRGRVARASRPTRTPAGRRTRRMGRSNRSTAACCSRCTTSIPCDAGQEHRRPHSVSAEIRRQRGVMKLKNSLSAVLLTIGLVAAAPVAAQEKPSALGLGIFTFTSGPAAAYGMPGKNAADLIIEDINARGGIADVPISVTYVY